MDWLIKKTGSDPALYLKVDLNGIFAYDTAAGAAMHFVDKPSADQLIRVLIDPAVAVQV